MKDYKDFYDDRIKSLILKDSMEYQKRKYGKVTISYNDYIFLCAYNGLIGFQEPCTHYYGVPLYIENE